MGYESTESQKPGILMNELRAVLDSIYSGIIAVDINGKITYINETAKKFMVCGEEIIGRDVNELIPLSRIKDVLHSAKPQYGVKLQIGDRTVLTNRTPIIINRQITGAVSSF